MIYFAISLILAMLAVLYIASHSQEGYEDENGYHDGKQRK